MKQDYKAESSSRARGSGKVAFRKGTFLGNAQTHVGVEVGDGLVARFGDALVLVAEVAEHRERAEELLAAVEGAASGPVPSGTLIATRLATIVANGQPGTVPSFGVVAPLGDGYLVLLHGTVSAEITGAPGVLRLSGEQAVTWVDQRIEVPVDRLSVTCREHPVKVDPMSDLRAGLVPGSGFVLTPGGPAGTRNPEVVDSEQAGTHTTQTSEGPAGLGEPTSAAEGAVGHVVTTTSVAAAANPTGAGATEDKPAGTTTGEEAGPAAVEAAPSEPVTVDALVQGIEAEDTKTETAARSPARSTEALAAPMGHLVSTEGVRIPLDRDYVLGREPEVDPSVRSGAATPVRLADDENLISRVHSYIAVDSGEVSLRDASSANGTYMAAPGDEAWARVGDDPVVLPAMWSVRVGNRVFTYVATGAA